VQVAVDQAGHEVGAVRVDDLGCGLRCSAASSGRSATARMRFAADGHVGWVDLLGEDVDQLAAPRDEAGTI